MLIPTMRLPPWVAALSSFLMIVMTLSAAEDKVPVAPAAPTAASYVHPIILKTLPMRYRALPERDQELFRLDLAGAQRYVLSREDGAFPDAGGEHWRNIAERTHGAAVLSLLPNDWPVELYRRCQQQSIDFITEFTAQFRKEPLFLSPGERGALGLHHLANSGHDLALITVALANQAHEKTAAAAANVSGSRGGDSMSCKLSPFFVWANFGDQEVAIQSPSAPLGPTTAKSPPHSVVILQEERGCAPLK